MKDELAEKAHPGPKRSTGPRSVYGKEGSSRNALTHGATSRRLINEDEQRAYGAWVQELSEAYPSRNPLVRMQIQRIAHLKVQLDRVQTAIAGLHEIERLRLEKHERAAQLMGLSRQDRADAMFTRYSRSIGAACEDSPPLADLPNFSEELLALGDLDAISTREDFEARAPLFCNFLMVSARESNQDIDDFTKAKRIVDDTDASTRGPPVLPPVVIRLVGGPAEDDSLRSKITDVPLEDLLSAAKFYRAKHWDQIARNELMKNVDQVADIAQQLALPDLDKMDKLMRYQTTIGRQLSTAVGELLAITRAR
jgi:hypothetical protein